MIEILSQNVVECSTAEEVSLREEELRKSLLTFWLISMS
jgi:hypothetical protein